MDNWNPMHSTTVQEIEEYMKSLGWEPRYTLRERIKEVVDWSLANPEWIEI